MNIGLQTTLIVFAVAIGVPADPTPSASVSPSPFPSTSSSAADTTASPDASAIAESASAPARTDLTAVFDPIAVPTRDGPYEGYRIRVGVRNSGPRSISAPAGVSAATFRLTLVWTGPSRSLGGCQYSEETPPIGGNKPLPAFYMCASGPTLRVGETYWESFFVSDQVLSIHATELAVSGYVEETDPDDNSCKVVVRPAGTGPGLPVTGTRTTDTVAVGLALIIAGVIAIWYGLRRRLTRRTNRSWSPDRNRSP